MRGRYASSSLTVEYLGQSPLVYHRSGDVRRLAVVDPAAPPPPKGDFYFADVPRNIYTGKNGRRLKKPRIEVTPGAALGTVAFLDYHEYGSGIYVDYMKTRQDYRGRGLVRQLVDELLRVHPNITFLHFGRMTHSTIGKIYDELVKRGGVSLAGHKDF